MSTIITAAEAAATIASLSQEVEALRNTLSLREWERNIIDEDVKRYRRRAEAAEAEAARLTAELTAAEQRVEHYKREGQGRLASIAIATAERDAARERVKVLEGALTQYADTYCEHGRDYEGCGKLNAFDCGGCTARAALSHKEG